MIYAENKKYSQVLMIPRTGREASGTSSAVLKIRSTTENREVYEIAAVLGGSTGLYHPVAITLPAAAEGHASSLKSGEYEYQLEQDGEVLSCGCMQIGEYKGATRAGASSGVVFSQGK